MLRTVVKFPCVVFLALALSGHASAQQPPPVKPPPTAPRGADAPRDPFESDQSSPREEMLKDVELKRLELVHKENLQRAKETAQLGAEVNQAFEQQKSLGAAELKKLGRIEKLARTIRNEAGGDDDEVGLKDPPARLDAALTHLSEMCEELHKKVEKTPRHVVSAAVITDANQIIALVKYIRTLGG